MAMSEEIQLKLTSLRKTACRSLPPRHTQMTTEFRASDSAACVLKPRRHPHSVVFLGDHATVGQRFTAPHRGRRSSGGTLQGYPCVDVSRWGRFQDPDESAHYEYLCKAAGIPVYVILQSEKCSETRQRTLSL
jgi:hypothetical protein